MFHLKLPMPYGLGLTTLLFIVSVRYYLTVKKYLWNKVPVIIPAIQILFHMIQPVRGEANRSASTLSLVQSYTREHIVWSRNTRCADI